MILPFVCVEPEVFEKEPADDEANDDDDEEEVAQVLAVDRAHRQEGHDQGHGVAVHRMVTLKKNNFLS